MSKIRVYLSKIDPHLSQSTYNDLLQIISKENRERCQRFRRKEDALRTLYGELILRHVLTQHFAFKNDEIEILKGESGKPYIKGGQVHYNISHSGDFAVCAFSEQEVGIDIEQIKEVNLRVAKKYFCRCECDDLFAQDIGKQAGYFYSLWALKESYMKWTGKGMAMPLNSFCFKIIDDNATVKDINKDITPFFKQLHLEGYKMAVCSMIEDFEVILEEVCVPCIVFG